MPYAKRKYRARKTYRKRASTTRTRKYGQRRYKRRTIARVGVVPRTATVRMRYVTQIDINPAVDQLATYAFRANSIYDPDYTGVGHQPMGHDQAQTLYERYTVLGSKITVKAAVSSTNDGYIPAIIGIYNDMDSTPPTSAQDLIEQGRCKHRVLTANPSSGQSQAVLTYNYSAKKYYGYKDFKDVANEISVAFGNNPARISYFTIFAEPLEINTNDVPPIHLLVQIDYIVRLDEPNDLASS